MKIKIIINLFLLITLFQYSSVSKAFPTTESDFAMLPPYCKARMNNKGTSAKRWSAKIGKMWIHIHHYCSGLDHFNKAKMMFGIDKVTKRHKQRALKDAISGINYVIERADSSFVLLPELHLKKGEVLINLGSQGAGIKEFYTSIKTNPKYSRGYVALSKNFKKLGKHKEALDIIQKGLKYNPKSKSLNRQLKKLKATK